MCPWAIDSGISKLASIIVRSSECVIDFKFSSKGMKK